MSNKQEAKVFTFNENNKLIRAELVDGEPWFVAKDVCDALTIGNSRDAISRLDDDEKGVSVVATPSGEQQMNIVNESGLYNLIFQSRKPEAKKFRKWVTGEVLPSIRKTGRYEVGSARASISSGCVDARDVPYERMRYMGEDVRVIVLKGVRWISINDLYRCLGIRTDSSQSARMLNARQTLAQKIHLFGNTHPAWFTTMEGARLLVSGSRKAHSVRKLMLDFKD